MSIKLKNVHVSVALGICMLSILMAFDFIPKVYSRAPIVPKFYEMKDVKAKKKAFFSFIAPMAIEENNKVMAQRLRVISILGQKKHSKKDIDWLNDISTTYNVRFSKENIQQSKGDFLARIDMIPVSLILAQAANESAWGTSRFAREGNNYFGEWCFTKNCGLVPNKRNKNASHEVKKFKRADESVRSYIHNLNTHPFYEDFRRLRVAQRNAKKELSGTLLAQGLSHYSERKNAYIHDIRNMIVQNELEKYGT